MTATRSTLLYLCCCIALTACSREKKSEDPTTVSIRIVHSPETASYLSAMAEQFQLTNPQLPDGTRLKIELKEEQGMTATHNIATGVLKTHGWLAPSLSLVNMANANLKNLGPRQEACTQLFATPMVLAIQPSRAQAVQAAEREFSWHELLDSVVNVPKEEVGTRAKLYFNHGNPLTSSTGFAALLQLAYFAAGTDSSLNLDQVQAPETLERIRRYENLAASYGISEPLLLRNVSLASGDRVLCSLTSEQQLAAYNSRLPDNSTPLIALYPREGSYWMDYSMCISNADWVTPAHRAGINLFSRFLASEPAQQEVERRGFRPSVVSLPPIPPLTKEFGVDYTKATTALLPAPGEVLNLLLDKWGELLRPAAMVFVIDTSGSIDGAPLRVGKDHLRNLLAASSWRDLKSLVSFATHVKVLNDFTADSAEVIPNLDKITALGGSAVYDAIKKSVDLISRPDLENYRKTILVYTDGEDKNSQASLNTLINLVKEPVQRLNVNIIIVGVSRDVQFDDLRAFARATNGMFRQGGLDDMDAIFREVAANL